MGGFISKAKAVPVEKKPEPEEQPVEKPASTAERKENEIKNLEGSGKVSEDLIPEEADEDAMDDLVGQAGKMSIEEEDAPKPVENEQETLYTTCTDEEGKDNQPETRKDQEQVSISLL